MAKNSKKDEFYTQLGDIESDGTMYETARTFWYINLNIPKRQEDLILYKKYTPKEYPKCDNYDAIEVSKTAEIPMDCKGAMGVPITFLDKYNPKQFEIIEMAEDNRRGLSGGIWDEKNNFKEFSSKTKGYSSEK